MTRFLIAAAALCALASAASARPRAVIVPADASAAQSGKVVKHVHAHARRKKHRRARHAAALVTVATVAGTITVDAAMAKPMQDFVRDLQLEAHYVPRRLKCYSLSKSHVAGSLHFIGRACDFDQCGWNCTPPAMRRISHIAARYGLRDGCHFKRRKDCGHVDLPLPKLRVTAKRNPAGSPAARGRRGTGDRW